jgi:hypothetical protein
VLYGIIWLRVQSLELLYLSVNLIYMIKLLGNLELNVENQYGGKVYLVTCTAKCPVRNSADTDQPAILRGFPQCLHVNAK